MRIETNGSKKWRDDVYEKAAKELGENTKSGAIDEACLHITSDIENKREAIEYLANELPPAKLKRVADMLSTEQIEIDVDVSVNVETSD